jgi:hypothetical protein
VHRSAGAGPCLIDCVALHPIERVFVSSPVDQPLWNAVQKRLQAIRESERVTIRRCGTSSASHSTGGFSRNRSFRVPGSLNGEGIPGLDGRS